MNTDRALELFKMDNQLKEMKEVKNNINSNKLDTVGGNEDIVNYLDKAVEAYTVEQLKDYTVVEEIYNGSTSPIDFGMEMQPERMIEFKRDYLVYIKESAIANKQIDDAIEGLEKELKESESEFQEAINSYSDLSTALRQQIIERIKTAEESQNVKGLKRAETSLRAFDDSIKCDRVYDIYSKLKPENTIKDYFDRAEHIYTGYKTVLKTLNLTTDLSDLNGLEDKLELDEKYLKYPNLFLFVVIKYISNRKSVATKFDDGIWISRFTVNAKSAWGGKMTETELVEFKASVTRILDLFI